MGTDRAPWNAPSLPKTRPSFKASALFEDLIFIGERVLLRLCSDCCEPAVRLDNLNCADMYSRMRLIGETKIMAQYGAREKLNFS